jgi:hypothetical protein
LSFTTSILSILEGRKNPQVLLEILTFCRWIAIIDTHVDDRMLLSLPIKIKVALEKVKEEAEESQIVIGR